MSEKPCCAKVGRALARLCAARKIFVAQKACACGQLITARNDALISARRVAANKVEK